jgi:hypothetical protein
VSCPECDHAAAYHADRGRTIVSAVGPVSYERAYYYCRRCGRGLAPFDGRAGVTARALSPGAERLATLAGGVSHGFREASDLLREMSSVRLSESTVERTTEDVGHRLAALLNSGVLFGLAVLWDWHPDARGRTVAYVTIDATGTRQQGHDGGPAEGRMAYVAAVYNPWPPGWERPPTAAQPPPSPSRLQARYLSGLYPLERMGPLLRRLAAHVGMERAEVWVALTDGGSGLEEFCQTNFNREDLVLILDFFHAASYLEALARALHPEDEAAAAQAEEWCGLLKAEGGATTLAVLENWDWPARQSAALQAPREEVRGYEANNQHRMDNPEYRAEGWQIGSGVVESACKTVVGARLKGAGMRWGEAGAHALCHVRALYRSEKGQWDDFWNRTFTQRTPVQQLT